MTARRLTPDLLPPPVTRLRPVTMCFPSRPFVAGSDVFGIFTTLRLPKFRLSGESSTRVFDPTLACFATLSDPLFIQDRRFIRQYGWWYHILLSTTALIGDFVSHGGTGVMERKTGLRIFFKPPLPVWRYCNVSN